MRVRTLWLLSLLVTALLVATMVAVEALVGPVGHHAVRPERERPAAASSTIKRPCATHARAVLRHWDRRRAAAWARGDPAALADLYAVGSRTARRDRAMLAAYRSRGLRVLSMRRQVLSVRVRRCRPDRISLRVTDRLVDAIAAGHGTRTGLPPGRPVTRRLDLRREGGVWRVSEVYDR